MRSPITLNSRAVVLGAIGAILILLSAQSTTAQTSTISQTDQQENESKTADRSEDSILDGGLSAPSTSQPQPQNCGIFAGLPQLNQADRILIGSGARGVACPSHANMRVILKQDRRFWFDRTLATTNGGGTNFELFARYKCKGTGGQIVYSEVRSGDKKKQSQRVGVFFCG